LSAALHDDLSKPSPKAVGGDEQKSTDYRTEFTLEEKYIKY
jgi:hypothetical protein